MSDYPWFRFFNPSNTQQGIEASWSRLRELADIFAFHVDSVHEDIRPLTTISSNNAVTDPDKGSFNAFESVPELPQALKGLESLSDIGFGIAKVFKGDPSGVGQVIKALSNGYLYQVYGAKPLLSDIAYATSVAKSIYAQLSDLSANLPACYYGDADTFRIPNGFPGFDGPVTVKVRSKLLFHRSPCSLLTMALCAHYAGALPTLARMWDLVPWSFAADWVTNMQDRLSDLDKLAIRAVLPFVGSVHSFTYEHRPSNRQLSAFGLSQVDDSFKLRMYRREVTRYIPGFWASTRYDFHPSPGINKFVSGALIVSSV